MTILHHRAASLVLIAVALAVAGCAGGGSSSAPGTPVATPVPVLPSSMHIVTPLQTDAAITTAFESHIAIAPGRATSPLLVVYLPGTGGTPSGASMFLNVSANAGAHAIGLMYPDVLAILEDCGDDPACYFPIRLQKFDGVSRSPIDPVGPSDAIFNRLTKLLLYLDAHFPSEGWGAFLSGNAPKWSSIALCGGSQGAGEAAAIGKVVSLARVVQLSGTVDAVNLPGGALAPATWVGIPGATPASAHYGFDHTADQFHAKIVLDWTALGQDAFGPRTLVETSSPPYGGSHELITSLPVANPHASSVGDGATPLDANGVPVFAPVWRYMLGL